MGYDEIAALIASGKAKEAYPAISAARRELELTGAEARKLNKLADESKPATTRTGGRR